MRNLDLEFGCERACRWVRESVSGSESLCRWESVGGRVGECRWESVGMWVGEADSMGKESERGECQSEMRQSENQLEACGQGYLSRS